MKKMAFYIIKPIPILTSDSVFLCNVDLLVYFIFIVKDLLQKAGFTVACFFHTATLTHQHNHAF